MTMEDAMKAARLVSAKHSIPYHMSIEKLFDREIAVSGGGKHDTCRW